MNSYGYLSFRSFTHYFSILISRILQTFYGSVFLTNNGFHMARDKLSGIHGLLSLGLFHIVFLFLFFNRPKRRMDSCVILLILAALRCFPFLFLIHRLPESKRSPDNVGKAREYHVSRSQVINLWNQHVISWVLLSIAGSQSNDCLVLRS